MHLNLERSRAKAGFACWALGSVQEFRLTLESKPLNCIAQSKSHHSQHLTLVMASTTQPPGRRKLIHSLDTPFSAVSW